MHKTIKRIASGFMAAAMTASIGTLTASAGQQLGQTDFDSGVGLPWHTCETNPAKQTFDISGGTYNVTIENNDGPESRWDLQLRHRGLKIEKSHTYKVHWEVTASTAGEMYTKIGDYSGDNEAWHNNTTGSDFDQCWNCVPIKQGKNVFEVTFTPKIDVDVAEWAFHYGGKGQYQDVDCFPNKTTLKFDNLSLIDVTSDENDWKTENEMGVVRPESNVRLNQVGYYPNLEKRASYVTDASSPLAFEIRDAKTGAVKYSGTTKNIRIDPDSGTGENTTVKIGDENVQRLKDSGKYVHQIDFTNFKTEGDYVIFVKDTVGVSGTQVLLAKGANDTSRTGDKLYWTNPQTKQTFVMNQSSEFKISKDLYTEQLLKDSMNYYYQNRAGVPIESRYITSGDASELSHSQYGHNPDIAYVQSKWENSPDETKLDKGKTVDGTGGWYDAGDHGKYVVNGGISVWTLQNAYEFTKKNGNDAKWTQGIVAIPENNDSNPDILDEARVELEWMFTMIDEDGFVYHKLHDHKWTGLAVHPWNYDGPKDPVTGEGGWGTVRIIKPATYAATFNMIACAAQAARLWRGIDDNFANKCLQKAEASWNAIIAKESKWNIACGKTENDPYFAPMDQAIGGGAYGDSYVGDDAYWAACELFSTTGKSNYSTFLKKYQNPNESTDKAFSLTTSLGGGENNGSFSSFNWGCTSGLGTISLYLSDKVTSNEKTVIESSIKDAANKYLEQMASQGMGVPYKEAVFSDPVNIGEGIEIKGYEWGSNSFVINNAIVLAYAYDIANEIKYMDGAAEALDYIFGRNGLGFSYVSGYGDKTMEWPHHRLWAKGVNPDFPKAPNGVLSGGPGAGMQDPYIGGLGYKRGTLANQKCYVDSAEAWSVNEVTINWNAPLVWMTTFMRDEAADAKRETTPVVTSNPTVTATAGDGKVDLKWNAVSGATGYRVVAKQNGSWVKVKETTGTSYTVSGLTNSKSYTFAVLAYVDGKFNEDTSKAVTVTPKAGSTSNDKAPTVTVEYNSQYHQFKLKWNAVSGAEAYGIGYYSAGKWRQYGGVLSAKTLSWISPKLDPGKSYKVCVVAKINGEWQTTAAVKKAIAVTIQ